MNYTKEFEDWWTYTYKGKLNPTPSLEEAFKEVAYAAWQHQQTEIQEARNIAEKVRDELNEEVSKYYKFSWE